jgi:chitin synthase
MSQYGNQVPQLGGLPFMPFSGTSGLGGGSVHGSKYGGMAKPGFGQPNPMFGMGGMGIGAPRNTVMTNLDMFSGSALGTNVSQSEFAPFAMQQQRPMSTFSMATSVNPFAGPSMIRQMKNCSIH